MSRLSTLFGTFLIRVVLALFFLFLGGLVVASANGYVLNRQTFRFESTGIVSLTTRQTPIMVSVNGKKKIYKKAPVNLSYLLPGRYSIEVSKPGYVTWGRSFTVFPGEVIINPSVVLFWADGATTEATPSQITLLQQQAIEANQDTSDLDVRGSELWTKPITRTYPITIAADQFNLIGRYASPILSAQWLPGKGQVLYQLGDEIRVIDRDGGNDITLVKLNSSTPTDYVATKNGSILIYRDSTNYFQRQLFED